MQQYEEQSSMVGGVASLSLARGARDGELYVIKRVRCFPCKTKEERMAMAYGVQEARLMMLLQHPNINNSQSQEKKSLYRPAPVTKVGRHCNL